jgi:hypothetical protein
MEHRTTDMHIPQQLQGFCSAFLGGLEAVLGRKLFAAYLYGAWAFPESRAKGDIDLQVILRDPLSEEEKAGIVDLHATIARGFPALASEGPDAYYILLNEARGAMPPRHQLSEGVVDVSWALHRAHMRAGRCMVLCGPDPGELYPEPSWEELDDALQGELDYVARHLADYPAYCVLNLCRLIYSHQTRDMVVSKYTSALWARDRFPAKASCIEAAMRLYEGIATAAEASLVEAEKSSFFHFACGQIEQARGRSQFD